MLSLSLSRAPVMLEWILQDYTRYDDQAVANSIVWSCKSAQKKKKTPVDR